MCLGCGYRGLSVYAAFDGLAAEMSPGVRFVYYQVLEREWHLSNQYRVERCRAFWCHSRPKHDQDYTDRVEVMLD